MAYRLSRAAEDQIETVLLESTRRHGTDAASRDNLLLLAAMAAIGDDPLRLGSSDIPRLPGVRAFPTRLIRTTIKPARRVRTPRHLIIFRISNDGVVEVLGLVHDRMVLSRGARQALRNANTV